MRFANLRRMWQIQRIGRKYGLTELFAEHLPKPFLGRRREHHLPRGERIRLALEELGPVFVKFGQALSTRRDLLPPDVAAELVKLHDQVPPFPGEIAKEMIEEAYKQPLEQVFESFDIEPMASASIAQVHAARLKPPPGENVGMEVVVKVLRPGVHAQIRRDVDLMYTLADLAERFWGESKRLHPHAVVTEYEKVIFDELDLLREGANASELRRNWLGSDLIYHPLVLFDHSRENVLVLERIHGIPIDDLAELRQAKVNFQELAERGVEIFFKQVFRDNFFHADMHPGNIFVDVSNPQRPRYMALDFGIVGSLSPMDQRYLAENFVAFFNHDYRRVAELHVESLWVPEGTRVEEFEGAIRSVCEPIFNKPLKDISFGMFLVRLFQTARRFNMEIQPQLVLLQKTILQIEGLGRMLYPELDLFKTAKPIMEDWMRERLGPRATLERIRDQLPALVDSLPQLAQAARRRLETGEPMAAEGRDAAFRELKREVQSAGRRSNLVVAGGSLVICGGLLVAFAAQLALVGYGLAATGMLFWLRAFKA